jgi:ATP-dependent DNA helicase RecG
VRNDAVDFSLLDKPIQFLKGVGPRRAESLSRMGLPTARHLLYHVPRRYDDASSVQPIGSLDVGMDATIVGRIRQKGVLPTRARLKIFQAIVEDDSGRITVAWPGQPWLDRKFREGDTILVTGPVRFYHGRQLQPRESILMARGGEEGGQGEARGRRDEDAGSGDSVGVEDASPDVGAIFVSYPASEDVPQWVLRRVVEKNLDDLLGLVQKEEYLPDGERERLGVVRLDEALAALHRPRSVAEAEAGRKRLAFDELFFLQLVQAQVRHRDTEERPGITHTRTNELIRPLHEALPFPLTGAQAKVLKEIAGDMTSRRRMSRMLQGDVGAGKTLVALFSMLLAAEGGWQSVLMAPTEILAEQHARSLRELVEPLGLEVAILTGRLGAAERREALESLASGRARLVVGTHALIQEGVTFDRLGLVVVDEQHRFGVRQRMVLAERNPAPDVLIMSATPIPRSLALTLYGELDLSVLDELPPGRTPIKTVLRNSGARSDVARFVAAEVAKGRQAYIVYPLVESSEKVDLRAATEEFERLDQEQFPDLSVGLVHGQMAGEEKDRVMRAFLAGEVQVLVATTVIEVGIDVANASIMVVEHAERFGLSQLHQLRGRVGRGAAESTCILVADAGDEAAERLKIFRDTNDGFAIARADLQIRGQGDLFGAQQSGRDPLLRFADLTRDEDLLIQAQALARRLVGVDPELARPEHERVRAVLEARHAERLDFYRTG